MKDVFMGYRRPDGGVGVRNHVLILPASGCASDTASAIAARVPGAVTFHNQNGCAQVASDMKLTMDLMAGFAANPNVFGTLAISLGCENCQMDLVVEAIRARTNKPLVTLVIQQEGGSRSTIGKGVRLASELAAQAAAQHREEFAASELILGTNCGGSDPTSGLAANPLLGMLSDRLVALGGTSILSETTEFIGAEHILARRASTPEVAGRIYEIIRRYERSLEQVGEEVRGGNPSPGNKAGGITTLEEKSLGCIHKGGSSPIEAVFDYAEPVTARGLVIMDTPGYDLASVAGMVAGGSQVTFFTTGRGTPTGNPVAPVVKITGNRQTWANLSDDLDFDASPALYGLASFEELADRLYALLLDTASGKLCRAEEHGFVEIACMRACNYV